MIFVCRGVINVHIEKRFQPVPFIPLKRPLVDEPIEVRIRLDASQEVGVFLPQPLPASPLARFQAGDLQRQLDVLVQIGIVDLKKGPERRDIPLRDVLLPKKMINRFRSLADRSPPDVLCLRPGFALTADSHSSPGRAAAVLAFSKPSPSPQNSRLLSTEQWCAPYSLKIGQGRPFNLI